MNRRGIIEELQVRRPKLSHRESATAVNAIVDHMIDALARGKRVEIRDFGTIASKTRRARQGRNPKTGEIVQVPAKRVVFFRAGKELKLLLNDGAAQGGQPRHS